jgi:hypothetical protein
MVDLDLGVAPGVFAQEGAGHECLAAVVATVGPLARVEPHVLDEGRPLGEGLAADGAEVGPLPGVRPRVDAQVLPLGEALAADLAAGDLLAPVGPHVPGEGRLRGELGPAQLAEALLRGLGQVGVAGRHVAPQALGLGEGPRAVLAAVERSPVVGAALRVAALEVRHEVALVVEALAADLALVAGEFALVQGRVLQVLGALHEAGAAGVAAERVIVGVAAPVELEVRLLVGGVIAELAAEALLREVGALVARDAQGVAEAHAADVALEGPLHVVDVPQVIREAAHVTEAREADAAVVLEAVAARTLFGRRLAGGVQGPAKQRLSRISVDSGFTDGLRTTALCPRTHTHTHPYQPLINVALPRRSSRLASHSPAPGTRVPSFVLHSVSLSLSLSLRDAQYHIILLYVRDSILKNIR